MSGLGNVYKSEVAFAAGVNPFRHMSTITAREMEAMVEASQRYMKANVADGAADGIVTYAGNRRTHPRYGSRRPSVGLRPPGPGVSSLRRHRRDAQAGRASALDLLVPRLPAVDRRPRVRLRPRRKAAP